MKPHKLTAVALVRREILQTILFLSHPPTIQGIPPFADMARDWLTGTALSAAHAETELLPSRGCPPKYGGTLIVGLLPDDGHPEVIGGSVARWNKRSVRAKSKDKDNVNLAELIKSP